MKIICFPHAGGNASAYYDLQGRIQDNAGLCPYEYDGHGKRRKVPQYKNFKDAVGKISNDLLADLLVKREPYCLMGHSMGAYIAVEVAYRLQQFYDYPPECIFISGQSSPIHIKNEYVEADEVVFLKYVQSLGGIPSIISDNVESMKFLLEPTRNDMRLLSTYHPVIRNCRLKSDLYVMYGKEDEEIEVDELKQWSRITSGKVEIQEFTGDHFYILESEDPADYINDKMRKRGN